MQGLTKAQEEIKALEGLRKQRLDKYQEALRKQGETKTSPALSVHQLDNDRKKVTEFQKSEIKHFQPDTSDISHIDGKIVAEYENQAQQRWESPRKGGYRPSTTNSSLSAAVSSPPVSSPSQEQKIKDAEEMTAKSFLARLLDKPGEESIVVTTFTSIRRRYLQAIEACRPTTIDVSNSVELEAAKRRRAARREQAQKKDAMGRIQRAWDNYEEKAQDRPSARDGEEMMAEEKVAQVEAEVNNAWISYAKQVAVEAAEEEDDDDLEYWIAEAKRLKAEAEARRLARLRALEERLRSEEDEYWIEEALKLRAKSREAKGKTSITPKNDTDEDVALALKLRSQQRKVYGEDDDNAELDGKQLKKGHIYGSDSDSEEDDKRGATFQEQRRKKTFAGDDDTEGLASKATKKNRVYGEDSDSDSNDIGGATAQRNARKKYDGTDDDGKLAVKAKKKSKVGNFSDSEDDKEDDSELLSGNQEMRKKDYGQNQSIGALATKTLKKGRVYVSDSDSNDDHTGAVTLQKETTKQQKTYGNNDNNETLPTKTSKKERSFTASSDSSEGEDKAAATLVRKTYGTTDFFDELAPKAFKKGRKYNSDSESDSDDKGGASFQKQRRKCYGDGDQDDTLVAKQQKKDARYLPDSDSDPDEKHRIYQEQIRKDYRNNGKDETLPIKASKKGRPFTDDSDSSDEESNAAAKLQRKKYVTTDSDVLAAKTFKKGRKYSSDSESDSDDEGGASFQKQRRKCYAEDDHDDTLDAKQKKKDARYLSDSNSDTDQNQEQKKFQSNAPVLSKAVSKKEKNFSGSVTGVAMIQKKSYGQPRDSELSSKQKKKTIPYNESGDDDDSDSGIDGNGKAKIGSNVADAVAKNQNASIRRKNYGRTYSGDGLPEKQKKKETFYLSENSEEPIEQPPVRRRQKRFEDNDKDDEFVSKPGRKLAQIQDSSGSYYYETEENAKEQKIDEVVANKAVKERISTEDENCSEVDVETSYYEGANVATKKKKKGVFVPLADSDDDVPKGSVALKRPSFMTQSRLKPKISDSQSSLVTRDTSHYSENQQSLNSSLADNANRSSGGIGCKDNSAQHSKPPNGGHLEIPSEIASSSSEENESKPVKNIISSRKSIQLKENDVVMNDEPKNPDGSPWKNPLKGWTNSPQPSIVLKGARFILKVPPKTACWRKTMNGKIIDSAPFHWQKITGDFRIQVKISGNFESDYQKAGIMIRLDEGNWLLSGMESFENRMHNSTYMTVDHTDRSMCQLAHNADRVGVWFSLKRFGGSYECHYSYDGSKWFLTRLGSFTERPVLYVGICAANPKSEDLRVSFDYYRCQTGGYLM